MKGPPMQPVHHAKGNFDMTKDEFRRIENAMTKPEFMGMLNEYMLEISDPKNKDEYDEYLKQLKKEGDLPKELKLVKPQAAFCMKTTITSKKDKSQSQKLFINCCHTPVVECPGFDVVEKNGKQGQNWRLPYSAGKMRYDQNSRKEVCTTIDVAFHPYTFQICNANHQFQELVCQTALDAANQQMGERNEIISKDYKVLKNMKCKGGEPALLTVRISGEIGDHVKKMQERMGVNQQGQPLQQQTSETAKRQNGEGYESSLYRDILNQKQEFTEEQKKQYEEKKRIEEASEVIVDEQIETNELKSQPIQAPKYKIVYSYPVQYEDFLDKREEANLKRPIELTVTVNLPRSNGIKDMSLDIEEKQLVLSIPDKYFLDIQLPYAVLQDEGNAKFDSKKKQLRIRLPINKDKLPVDLAPPKTFAEFSDTREEELGLAEDTISAAQLSGEAKEKVKEDTDGEHTSDGQKQTDIEEKIAVSEESTHKKKDLKQLNVLNQQEKIHFLEEQAPQIEVIGSEEVKQTVVDEDDEIEEIVAARAEQQRKQQSEIKNTIITPVIEKKRIAINYKLQETAEKVFLVFNIPKYESNELQTLLFDDQVFILHETKKSLSFARIEVSQPIDASKSSISLVTDYVVVNLQKTSEEYWPTGAVNMVIDDDYEIFQLLMGEMRESKRLSETVEKKEEETELENEKLDNLDGLEGEQQYPAEKEEPKKLELDSRDDTQVIKLKDDGVSRNVLQFIEFSAQSFALEID